MAAIRCPVGDAERSIGFYTRDLGFKLEQQMSSAFARVSRGDPTLRLAGPQSSAARPMPDGRRPEPGGWDRFVIPDRPQAPLARTLAASRLGAGWRERRASHLRCCSRLSR
jgi:hypothetical protein